MACSLCDPSLGPVITESQYWRLVLNHNQNLDTWRTSATSPRTNGWNCTGR
jgi:hypothetical protein